MKHNWLIWIPRVMVMLLAAFMLLFSFDVFEGDESLGMKLLGFLMHSIPSILLVICLLVSWKHPLAGGIILLVITAAMAYFFKTYRGWETLVFFSAFPLVAAILYFVAHFISNRR